MTGQMNDSTDLLGGDPKKEDRAKATQSEYNPGADAMPGLPMQVPKQPSPGSIPDQPGDVEN